MTLLIAVITPDIIRYGTHPNCTQSQIPNLNTFIILYGILFWWPKQETEHDSKCNIKSYIQLSNPCTRLVELPV